MLKNSCYWYTINFLLWPHSNNPQPYISYTFAWFFLPFLNYLTTGNVLSQSPPLWTHTYPSVSQLLFPVSTPVHEQSDHSSPWSYYCRTVHTLNSHSPSSFLPDTPYFPATLYWSLPPTILILHHHIHTVLQSIPKLNLVTFKHTYTFNSPALSHPDYILSLCSWHPLVFTTFPFTILSLLCLFHCKHQALDVLHSQWSISFVSFPLHIALAHLTVFWQTLPIFIPSNSFTQHPCIYKPFSYIFLRFN